MTTKINNQGVAVDRSYFWQPMSTCPPNTKVQLLNAGKVAVYGTWDGKSNYWLAWAPLPKFDEEKLKRPEQTFTIEQEIICRNKTRDELEDVRFRSEGIYDNETLLRRHAYRDGFNDGWDAARLNWPETSCEPSSLGEDSSSV